MNRDGVYRCRGCGEVFTEEVPMTKDIVNTHEWVIRRPGALVILHPHRDGSIGIADLQQLVQKTILDSR